MNRLLIIILLIAYTAFEGVSTWPAQPAFAVALSMLIFFIMLPWIMLYHSQPQLINKLWFKRLTWIGTFAMGFWSTFVLLSIPVNIIFLITYLIAFFDNAFLWLSKVNLVLLVISAIINILGYIEITRGPKVKSTSLFIPHLPQGLRNLKIAQISDLHIGPTIGAEYVKNVVDLTNATHPDFIFITGDLADANADMIEKQLQLLGNLSARYGIYFVTGNHEYYWDANGLIAFLNKLNIIFLINENKIIRINDCKLMIAGITDPAGAMLSGNAPNMNAAIASEEKADFKILLAHRPNAYVEAEKMGFDLQFSGHTHAGQFFPFNILIPLAHKYYKGLNYTGKLWLYVNQGTGYWGPANRFGIPAEITLLHLI